MVNFFNMILLVFGLIVFLFSIIHYKSIFNPLGIYVFIWSFIIFLYELQLSYYLKPLNFKTYLVLYLSIFMFLLGCLINTKKKYPVFNNNDFKSYSKNNKIIYMYFFLVLLALLEIIIKTPPLIAENQLAVYLSGGKGIGVRFLHYSLVLIPINYVFIYLKSKVSNLWKLILSIPLILFPLLWMQRGILLSNIFLLIILYFKKKRLSKQVLIAMILLVLLIMSFNVIGNYRSASDIDSQYIFNLSNLKVEIPNELVWLYIYPTTSLYNFQQTINTNNFKYIYGFELIEPVFSLLQLKFLNKKNIFNYEKGYIVKGGFNTPTYLHWIYRNFGYLGFVVIPFVIGFISQVLFNYFKFSNNEFFVAFYLMWIPNVIFSFHDFLFWNTSIIFSVILIFILSFKFNFREFKILKFK